MNLNEDYLLCREYAYNYYISSVEYGLQARHKCVTYLAENKKRKLNCNLIYVLQKLHIWKNSHVFHD